MPIPPPPPGPPPPPAPPAFGGAPIGGAPDPNGRNLLLQSIRQGARLKKTTVVNDRSSPLVAGKFSNGSNALIYPVSSLAGMSVRILKFWVSVILF